jgi:hypothetical protein
VPTPEGSGTQSTSIAAPIGGWNRRDSLGAMEETDAIVMDNFISTGGFVKLRSGYKKVIHTGDGNLNPVESLFTFTAGVEDQLLFSMRNPSEEHGDIYKVAEDWSTYDSILPKDESILPLGSRWKTLQFQKKLFLVSEGLDEPLVYDGEKLEKHDFEVDDDDDFLKFEHLTDIASYNRRLFFIEKGTLNLWFTEDIGKISGMLKYMDLSEWATRGGELVEIEEWTRTGANDLSSMLVALTSEGEVFMFQGMDPTSLGEWKMEGTYQIPSPVGFHCATRMMDDLVFATRGGYYTAAALTSVKEATKEMAISDKIRGAIDGLKPFYRLKGWQIEFLQSENMLLINIPVSNVAAQQFVYNLENKTWSRFTGIDAFSFTTYEDKVYFGGKEGGIFALFQIGDDNGRDIGGTIQQAFSTFQVSQKKRVKSVSVNVGSPFQTEITLQLSCDFNTNDKCTVWAEGVNAKEEFATWDRAQWNFDNWGTNTKAADLSIQELSTPIDGEIARYISIALSCSVGAPEDYDFIWHSTSFTYETALQ